MSRNDDSPLDPAVGQWVPINPRPFEEIQQEMYQAWVEKQCREAKQLHRDLLRRRVPTSRTMKKYEQARAELAKGRKKSRVARELGYKDFRALNKMMAAVEKYLRDTRPDARR